jgi:hypothetical protein
MKKFLKIFSIIIVLLLAAMIALPYLFKDKIVEVVKTEINNSVDAQVDFQDFSLSLFRSFPDFSFGIEGLEVINKAPFEGDTLMHVEKLLLTLDLSSVISGDSYEIKSIQIKEPTMYVKILKNGSANYDIVPEDTVEVEEVAEEESSAFSMKLQEFIISDGHVVYDDRDGDMMADVQGLDLVLGGDFTESTTDLDLEASIKSLTYEMEGLAYLKQSTIDFDAEIAADLDQFKFTFKDNSLILNQLALAFDGWLAMPADDIDMDISFAAPKADFKALLSLVPAIYLTDMEGLEATGKAGFSGFVKGTYNDELMPAFRIHMDVDKGRFQYPDLPQAVENVDINAEINSPSSDMDDMVIDISRFYFEVANNPMEIYLNLKTPMSDPEVDARFVGKLNLADVEKFYPLDEGMNLSGVFDMDVALKGKQSSIDKEQYGDFKSEGYMKLNQMKYADADLPEGIEIAQAEMEFNPRYISLNSLEATYMNNTLSSNGKLTNYIDYAFGDGVLEGNLNLKADYLNIDQMMGYESAEETEEAPVDTSTYEAFEVPENIDFQLKAIIGRIKYDQMDIRAIYGALRIADARVNLENLNMEMLGGKINLNGFYSTVEADSPHVNMIMGIKNFGIKESYETFNTLQTLAPMAKYMEGTFSTLLTYNSLLDNQMNPVLNTVDAQGLLKTTSLKINNAPSFTKIASALKYDKLKAIQTKPVMVDFAIEDGNLTVQPFEVVINDIPAQVSGTANIDKTVNYTVDMDIPTSKLGASATAMVDNLQAKANKMGLNTANSETIPVRALITGPAHNPEVKVDVTNPAQNVQDQLEDVVKNEIKKVEDQAKEELEKKKKELLDEAARKKQQAQDSIQRVIDSQKAALEKKKKEEEEKAKKKLEEEAKKRLKGFF